MSTGGKVKVPATYSVHDFAEVCGLINYGANIPDAWHWSRRASRKKIWAASAETPQPGDIVILDNLSSHKIAGIPEDIEPRW